MKYKLINQKTGQETLCDKVTIDGFDYYESGKELTLSDTLNTCYYIFNNTLYKREYSHHKGSKKVIATTNPNIDIPKVVDEVESLLENYYAHKDDGGDRVFYSTQVREIINKYQETQSNPDKDMIEFVTWVKEYNFLDGTKPENEYSKEELLQLWREQQPKIVYYDL